MRTDFVAMGSLRDLESRQPAIRVKMGIAELGKDGGIGTARILLGFLDEPAR